MEAYTSRQATRPASEMSRRLLRRFRFWRPTPGTTMAEETIDPSLLEQTKNQIRKLVAEIAELAESDIQPPEFHAEFLTRVVAAVAASGGALWMVDGRGGLKLQHQL